MTVAIASAEADAASEEAVGGVLGRIAHSGLWLMLAYVGNTGAAFGCSLLASHALGPSGFGRYSYYLAILTLAPMLLALGVPLSITRVLAQELGSNEPGRATALFRFARRVHVVVGGIAAVVIAGAILAGKNQVALALSIAGAVLILVLAMDYEAFLAALRRFRLLSAIAVGSAAVQAGVIAGGVVAGASWRTLVELQALALALGGVALVLPSLGLLRRHPAHPLEPASRSRFVRYAKGQAVRDFVTQVVWGRPELFFLARYASAADVGLYSAAFRLSTVPAIVAMAMSRVLVPEFAHLRGRGAHGDLEDIYPRVCKMLAVITVPLALGGAALAGRVEMIFGHGFDGAATASAILLAGGLVNALQGPSSAALLTGPSPELATRIGVGTVIFNLVADFVVIPRYGVVGAAAVNVTAQAIAVTIGVTYAWVKVGLRYPLAEVARVLGVGAVTAAIALVIVHTVTGWIGFVGAIVAGALAYGVLLIASGAVTPGELRSLRRAAA